MNGNSADIGDKHVKKTILILSILGTLAVPLPAHAVDGGCGYKDAITYESWDGDDDNLTPAELRQIERIRERADRRADQGFARVVAENEAKQKREAFRRSQCTIPLLWIGCPRP
jgi:hypothetical protein